MRGDRANVDDMPSPARHHGRHNCVSDVNETGNIRVDHLLPVINRCLVRRLKTEQEGRLGPMKVIATGGVASLFEGASSTIDVFDHDLTSQGLLEIFKRNGGTL